MLIFVCQAIWLSLLSLLVSCLMSSPLFMMTELKVYTNLLSEGVTSFCYEVVQDFRHLLKQTFWYFQNWAHVNYHLTYTIICFLVQYFIPSIIIGYIYYKVCKSIPITQTSKTTNNRTIRKMARRRRTNNILIAVSLVFFICWAPINMLNILLNISNMLKV